jgi:hypothetical protein
MRFYVAGAYGLQSTDGRTFAAGSSVEVFLPDTRPRVFRRRAEAVKYAESLYGQQVLGGKVSASKVLRYWADGAVWRVCAVHYVDGAGSHPVRRPVRYVVPPPTAA